MDEKPKLPLLLFDGECTLCVRFKDTLLRTQGFENLNTLPYQNEKVYSFFENLNQEECSKEIHLILETEEILVGANALEYLLKQNPTVSKFSWLIDSGMGKKAVDYFHQMTDYYRKLAKQRCPNCM